MTRMLRVLAQDVHAGDAWRGRLVQGVVVGVERGTAVRLLLAGDPNAGVVANEDLDSVVLPVGQALAVVRP
jgi:hypothetical protein